MIDEQLAVTLSVTDALEALGVPYAIGAAVSDRQWRDVLGVLKVQGERLDLDYLRAMAGELGVSDLLRRAIDDAGP